MSVRFSWTVQESDGDAVVGANVDLYYSGGAKYADMTDNGDGSYYCSVTASGKYDVYIGGVKQDEGTGIWISTDDSPTAASVTAKADKVTGATNNNFASLDASGNLKDSTYDATDFLTSTHVNANGAGGSSTPATNKVHNAAAIAVTDAGGLLTATDVEAALAEIKTLIGTMGISTGSFISGLTNITDCLLALNNQLYDLYLRGGDNSTQNTTFKQHYLLSLSGNSGASGFFSIGDITVPLYGFNPIRDGSITGIGLTWNDGSMSGTTITINYSTNVLMTVTSADVADKQKSTTFPVGDYPVSALAGMVQMLYERTAGAGYLADMVLTVEVTFGLATS